LRKFQRESCWTESIAVGGQDFTERIRAKLGVKAKGRKIVEKKSSFELREARISYKTILAQKI
jgi:putative transposase